jgi:hypothetical protein
MTVAIAAGWAAPHARRERYWQQRVRMLEAEQEQLIIEADKLAEALGKAGIDPPQ